MKLCFSVSHCQYSQKFKAFLFQYRINFKCLVKFSNLFDQRESSKYIRIFSEYLYKLLMHLLCVLSNFLFNTVVPLNCVAQLHNESDQQLHSYFAGFDQLRRNLLSSRSCVRQLDSAPALWVSTGQEVSYSVSSWFFTDIRGAQWFQNIISEE